MTDPRLIKASGLAPYDQAIERGDTALKSISVAREGTMPRSVRLEFRSRRNALSTVAPLSILDSMSDTNFQLLFRCPRALCAVITLAPLLWLRNCRCRSPVSAVAVSDFDRQLARNGQPAPARSIRIIRADLRAAAFELSMREVRRLRKTPA